MRPPCWLPWLALASPQAFPQAPAPDVRQLIEADLAAQKQGRHDQAIAIAPLKRALGKAAPLDKDNVAAEKAWLRVTAEIVRTKPTRARTYSLK